MVSQRKKKKKKKHGWKYAAQNKAKAAPNHLIYIGPFFHKQREQRLRQYPHHKKKKQNKIPERGQKYPESNYQRDESQKKYIYQRGNSF